MDPQYINDAITSMQMGTIALGFGYLGLVTYRSRQVGEKIGVRDVSAETTFQTVKRDVYELATGKPYRTSQKR